MDRILYVNGFVYGTLNSSQPRMCPRATVAMCDSKRRRAKNKALAEYDFPVVFPNAALFKKRRANWSVADTAEVALWLELCGNAIHRPLLPAPTIAWAHRVGAAVAQNNILGAEAPEEAAGYDNEPAPAIQEAVV